MSRQTNDSKSTNEQTPAQAAKAAKKRAASIEAAKAKNPADLTLTELRLLVSERKAETAGADAVGRGHAKLAKLRTFAIRQRAWGDAATAKGCKANDKAETAEISMMISM